MKRMLVATAIVLAMVIMVSAAPAKAETYTSFVGIGATGTDPYGNAWVWNTTSGSAFPFQAGESAWGIPGLGLGIVTWKGPVTTDFDFVIGTKETVMPAINLAPPTGAGGYDETTRFVNATTGQLWTMVSVSPTQVEFFAPAGGALVTGDTFFVNIVLTGPINPATAGFVATYSQVPVPPTLLLLAPGLLGLVGMRKRLKG